MMGTRADAGMRRVGSALVGSVLIAGLTALVSAPAMSAPTWLPEVEVTDGPAVLIREVASALAPDGTFVVAWAENQGATWTVEVATRAPGAAGFSAPVEAAPPGGSIRHVVLVVDGTGTTTVAWARGFTSSPAGRGCSPAARR